MFIELPLQGAFGKTVSIRADQIISVSEGRSGCYVTTTAVSEGANDSWQTSLPYAVVMGLIRKAVDTDAT